MRNIGNTKKQRGKKDLRNVLYYKFNFIIPSAGVFFEITGKILNCLVIIFRYHPNICIQLNTTRDQLQLAPSFLQFTNELVEILLNQNYNSTLQNLKSVLTVQSKWYFFSTTLDTLILCLKIFGGYTF